MKRIEQAIIAATATATSMPVIPHNSVPEERHTSPAGRFEVFRRHLSLAAGGGKDCGPEQGGHPFDVEIARIPAGRGRAAWALHRHSSQWEAFIILSGSGLLRHGESGENTTAARPGDFLLHPPGETHQLLNDSDEEDLIYYVLATNPGTDAIYYPESNKWFVKPMRKVFREGETPLPIFDGEE